MRERTREDRSRSSTRIGRTPCCAISSKTSAAGFAPSSAAFFELVLGHTIEGTFCDPHYGGNRDFIGWDLIGYPGLRLAVTAEQQRMSPLPAPTRISAYDLGMFEPDSPAAERDDR